MGLTRRYLAKNQIGIANLATYYEESSHTALLPEMYVGIVMDDRDTEPGSARVKRRKRPRLQLESWYARGTHIRPPL